MKKPLAAAVMVCFLVVACCGVLVLFRGGNLLRSLYNDLVLDNRDHFLPCEALPPVSEVNRVLEDHKDTVEAILDVNPGHVFMEVDEPYPGRADIVISYATHRDRVAIEELIGGDTFFGVPCRLRNTEGRYQWDKLKLVLPGWGKIHV